ncbi:MAG: formate dehydrogenase subunit gamma [Deltaproteobacteria bacterium]|nr:formate dehydrogenase subunit gamma [Deltaproteobacteria bacterium]
MRKNCLSFLGLTLGLVVLALAAGWSPAWGQAAGKAAVNPLIADFQRIMAAVVTADWQGSGQFFIMMQRVFSPLFLGVLLVMVVLFAAHYVLVGAKNFDHEGEKVFYYSILCRLVHALAAASFTILVFSGLLIIFGKVFHGGALVRTARYFHAPAAVVFVPASLVLFLLWVKDMLPAAYDLDWLLVFGGYLSRKKITVPAGKFNPGQKSWFWLAVGGGLVMAYTGYYLFSFSGDLPALRLAAVVHNLLGVVLLAMFMIHLYMALFAVKGSLQSMLTGYKSAEEVAQMHSEYWRRLS